MVELLAHREDNYNDRWHRTGLAAIVLDNLEIVIVDVVDATGWRGDKIAQYRYHKTLDPLLLPGLEISVVAFHLHHSCR